jgi:hypothetical protein
VEKLSTRVIGVSTGVCAACGDTAQLEVVESRRRRRMVDLLDRGFSESVLRTATCRSCFTRYPIRATDDTADGATTRRARTHGRDWNYPRVA